MYYDYCIKVTRVHYTRTMLTALPAFLLPRKKNYGDNRNTCTPVIGRASRMVRFSCDGHTDKISFFKYNTSTRTGAMAQSNNTTQFIIRIPWRSGLE